MNLVRRVHDGNNEEQKKRPDVDLSNGSPHVVPYRSKADNGKDCIFPLPGCAGVPGRNDLPSPGNKNVIASFKHVSRFRRIGLFTIEFVPTATETAIIRSEQTPFAPLPPGRGNEAAYERAKDSVLASKTAPIAPGSAIFRRAPVSDRRWGGGGGRKETGRSSPRPRVKPCATAPGTTKILWTSPEPLWLNSGVGTDAGPLPRYRKTAMRKRRAVARRTFCVGYFYRGLPNVRP